VRWIARALVALLAVVLLAVLGGWLYLRASLPALTGEAPVAGLGAPVTVERDSLGVVRITADSRADALRALGYVHAQERFFGMDLLRRAAAGELAALLGPDLVGTDTTLRVHRFRSRARAAVEALPPDERALLTAYTDGANAGLAALGARPFEYAVLRQAPEPWREEDAFLVAFAMFLDLQRANLPDELETLAERTALPAAVAAFLDPAGDGWDAPLTGDAVAPVPVPPPDMLGDYRPGAVDTCGVIAETFAARGLAADEAAGSNNMAVAGARTATGAALVADDMHLGLRLPHLWFRAEMTADGRRIGGVTLPGVPAVIVGATEDVAWGFTNSYGDFIDLVRLVPTDDGPAGGFVTADGPMTPRVVTERIAVAGADTLDFAVEETPFGPILFTGSDGARYAAQWSAHRAGAVNLALGRMWDARSLDDVFAVAHAAGIPAQNVVAGDRAGRIGWTVGGQIPRREGRDGQFPVDSTDPAARWSGWLAPDEVPRVTDPADGVLWTANNRVASGSDLARIGLGPYAHGARAQQIRDGLRAHEGTFEVTDLLAIQLDDRALFLGRWQALLLGVLDDDALAGRPDRAALRERVAAWGARASVESPGYGVVKRFRDALGGRLTPALLAPARDLFADADDLGEAALWTLASEQPAHFLPDGAASWRDVLLAAADAAADAPPTWGDANRAAIAHPMADALPVVGRYLRMPADPLAGDGRMPRVARSSFGASQRMVVSPGHEDDGVMQMPGGQAGHRLSPYWGAGHDAWVTGRPTPFRPGAARWTLTLVPG